MAKISILGTGGFGVSLAATCHRYGHEVTLWGLFQQEVDAIIRDGEHKKLLPGVPVNPGIQVTADIQQARYGHEVTLWGLFQQEVDAIIRDGEHKKLLPGVPVNPGIQVTADIQQAAGADLLILAVPSFAIRETAARARDILSAHTVVASVAKGLEQGSHKLLSEVIEEELPGRAAVILSGPSHAEEIARGVPTTLDAASRDRVNAEYVQDTLSNERLRIYVCDDMVGVQLGGALKNIIAVCAGMCDGMGLGDNAKAALMTRGLAEIAVCDDMVGVQLGGALKNIIAVCAGMCDGMGLGDNAKAALMTRGLAEIARLGVEMGADPATFAGLTGIGDLIVTCTSLHSRNYRTGLYIGQGIAPGEAVQRVGMTVEGCIVAQTALELARSKRVEMPIVEQLNQVLYGGKSPERAVHELMGRPSRHENEQIWLKEHHQA